ncbi:SRPBCC family protein [Rhizobium sullae]|uniref:SRPBCC family protein n=1 Tax=Rhizobium sullae TaxID=50338 RepID=UPI002467F8E9|nr:SRPBCC family protein [Rhizobium sullae]
MATDRGGRRLAPDWLPYIPKSELSEGGRVRRLENPDGEAIAERLEAFDNQARSYSYSILQAPFPITDYRSTLCVHDAGNGERSTVEWVGHFTPNGVSDQEATAVVQGIYQTGLAALLSAFVS